jgi:hypothetical protein
VLNLDQFQDNMSNLSANDDRRSRQLLEEQVKIISNVCKKLNQDIEVN